MFPVVNVLLLATFHCSHNLSLVHSFSFVNTKYTTNTVDTIDIYLVYCLHMKTKEKARYRLNIYIDEDFAHKVRVAAVTAKKPVSRYIEDTLKEKINTK